jgi:hypothetical protein
VMVVGGGAGGVEVALAIHYRLEQERRASGRPDNTAARVRCGTSAFMESHVRWRGEVTVISYPQSFSKRLQ